LKPQPTAISHLQLRSLWQRLLKADGLVFNRQSPQSSIAFP